MKKQKTLAGLLALALVAQGVPLNVLAADVNDVKISATQNLKESPSDIITIPDPVLKTELTNALLDRGISVTNGNITRESAEKLTELVLLPNNSENISSLKGLEAFKNVKFIRMEKANISDISELKNLKNLEILMMKDNEITDVTALKDLKNLRTLDLRYNKLTNEDIVTLSNITSLKFLHLSNDEPNYTPKKSDRNNKISDISSLAKLPNLKKVKLGGNAISDISPLKNIIATNDELAHKLQDNQKVVKNKEIKASDIRKGSVEIDHGIVGFDKNVAISDIIIKDSSLVNKIDTSYSNGKIKLTFKESLPSDVKSIKIGYKFSNKLEGASFSGDVDLNIAVKQDEEIVNIPDPVLKTELKNALFYEGITIKDDKITKADAEKLKELILLPNNSKNIKSLEGIGAFKNITFIRMEKADISDISELSKLKNLEVLKMQDNEISDVTALKDLKKLATVDLRYNKLTDEDMTNLANISSLKFLYLNNDEINYIPKKEDRRNKISNVSPLAKLTNLKRIKVGGNAVSDISQLKNIIVTNDELAHKLQDNQKIVKNKEIKTSDIKNGSIEIDHGIVGFDKNIAVSDIVIKDSSLANKIDASYSNGKIKLTFKESLPSNVNSIKIGYKFSNKLEGASFSGDVDLNINVKHVEEIVNIPDPVLKAELKNALFYEGITIKDDKITKTDAEKLTKILLTQADSKDIKSLEGLGAFKNVTFIKMERANISDISELSKLKNLEVLMMQDNEISDVSALKDLKKLKTLDLRYNKLTDEDMANLANISSLKFLHLNNDEANYTPKKEDRRNKISNVSPLAKLTNLKKIKVGGNAVSDISPLKNIIINGDEVAHKFQDNQVIEVVKHVNASDKTFDITNDIKGFNDKITEIKVENGIYNKETGKITITDLSKPVSYTFKDECKMAKVEGNARFSGTVNVKLIVEPSEIIPESFTVKFVQPNGRIVKETVLKGYTGIFAPRLIMPNGEMAVWKADCVDLVLNNGDYISAQTLDLDFTWGEKNPTIIFKPIVTQKPAVMPESFTVKFVQPDGRIVKETVLKGYKGIFVPRLIMPDGEMAVWKADCVDLVLNNGDYISAQTLDLDFTWTEKNPTIIFNVVK